MENQNIEPNQSVVQDAQPVQQPQAVQQPPVGPAGAVSEAEQGKIWAILGYILGFLFFIPLINELKNNQFSRFHANQQLVLFGLVVGKTILFTFVIFSFMFASSYGLYRILSLVSNGLSLAFFVLAIIGIMNAVNGQMKELPLIGGIKIIK